MIKVGKLRRFDTFEIDRPSPTGGYFDDYGKWIPAADEKVTVSGNLQPYPNSPTEQDVLPDGLKASDAKLFYTQDTIKTVNQYSKEEADKLIIDNEVYIAMEVLNHSSHKQLTLWHYRIMFVRRDTQPV